MIDFQSLEHTPKGRLDPTVREIAARTQVKPENFRQCPNCGALMNSDLEIYDYNVAAVYFSCHNCQKIGRISSEGKVEIQ